MKRVLAFLLILITLPTVISCGKDKIKLPEKITYYDNLSVVGLAVNAEEDLTNAPPFVDISPDVLQDAGGIRLDLCESYVSKKSNDARLDEYGIFHCKNEDALDSLYESVKNYVNNRKNDSVTLSHFEDADTVRNGSVACYGNYVVYTFLAENGNSAFHDCVEALLRE